MAKTNNDRQQPNSNGRYYMLVGSGTIIAIVALIGRFWGAEGFRWVGLGLGLSIFAALFIGFLAIVDK